jgi:hypothetical protein
VYITTPLLPKYIEVTSLLQLDNQKRRKSERKRKGKKVYNDRAG